MPIQPVNRKTLVQQVTDQLISFILEKDLQPGEKLPSQQKLMEKLQVGRSTVREALKGLAAMGIVDMKAGYGTFVKKLDSTSVIRPDLLALVIDKGLTEQLLEAREIIEPEIVYLAAQRATDDDLAAIQGVLDKCEEAIRAGEPVYRLSSEFHRAMTEAAHNEILLMFMDSILNLLVERGLLLEQKPGFTEWELQSHREIFEYVAQRDGQKARIEVAEHVEESSAVLLEMLQESKKQSS
jgi:GntR family transcriptional repressor for pyruvate dehydrogenase complex